MRQSTALPHSARPAVGSHTPVQRAVLDALRDAPVALDDLATLLEQTSRYTRVTVRAAVAELTDSGDLLREGNLLISLEPDLSETVTCECGAALHFGPCCGGL